VVGVEPVERTAARPLVGRHRPAVEAPAGVAAALVHPNVLVAPQLVEERQRAIGLLERETALDTEHRTALATGSDGGADAAHVPTLDRPVRRQREDVASQHVDPAQPAPSWRPDGSLAVVCDDVGYRSACMSDSRATLSHVVHELAEAFLRVHSESSPRLLPRVVLITRRSGRFPCSEAAVRWSEAAVRWSEAAVRWSEAAVRWSEAAAPCS
jgi:hypothetical protein